MLALTLASLLLPAISYYAQPAAASACVAMDTSFSLLVFGVGGKDYNASTQDSWTSGTPPFHYTLPSGAVLTTECRQCCGHYDQRPTVSIPSPPH